MNEVGEKLKQARKEKGYTLDDLQQITKIQKRYLEAIEDGNLDIMPGKFYARAFIKQYADTVGLDGDELLKEHIDEVPKAQVGVVDSEQTAETQSRVHTKKSNDVLDKVIRSLPTVIVTLIVLALLVFIWISFSKNKSNHKTSMIDTSSGIVVSQVESGQTKESASSTSVSESISKKDKTEDQKQEMTNTSSDGRTSMYTVANAPAHSTITIAATASAWVQVNDDSGASLFAGSMTEGQTEEVNIEGAQVIHMSLGNSKGTSITVNGEALVYSPEVTSVVQNITLTFEPVVSAQ